MTQIPLDVIAAAAWRAFSAGTPETEARESYVKRIGTQPQFVGLDQWGRDVLAGPVPQSVMAACAAI
jgi:hypothetical protein